MNHQPKNIPEVMSVEPIHRLDAYFQEPDRGFIKTLQIIDAVQDATSPLRGLIEILGNDGFASQRPEIQGCYKIMSAVLKDLDYVVEKWRSV